MKLINVNGKTFTVQYLKESHRLVSKTLSGELTRSSDEPRVATRRGLPLIIPGELRLLLEGGNAPSMVRAVLTLLTSYRVMPAAPKLKLETITASFSGLTKTLPEVALIIDDRFRRFIRKNSDKPFQKEDRSPLHPSARLLSLNSSGPNGKVQSLSYPHDALAFKQLVARGSDILKNFSIVASYTGKDLYKALVAEMESKEEIPYSPIHARHEGVLGRLALKPEPAGKMRVFAIVDG